MPNGKNFRIVIDIMQQPNNLARIFLTNQEGGNFNKGFESARKNFDPDKIISILCDNIPIQQLRKLVDDSLRK